MDKPKKPEQPTFDYRKAHTVIWRGIIHGYKHNAKRCFEIFHQEHFIGGLLTHNKHHPCDWFYEEESNGDLMSRTMLPAAFEDNTDDEFFAEVMMQMSVEYRCYPSYDYVGEECDPDFECQDVEIAYIPKKDALRYYEHETEAAKYNRLEDEKLDAAIEEHMKQKLYKD